MTSFSGVLPKDFKAARGLHGIQVCIGIGSTWFHVFLHDLTGVKILQID